ncbi:uncharacterized protein LOC134290872 [Aedes albopictus]|uniref:Uncharacterized protein n=1 Tax=Aedes albopictus TaxID=7160 RepID=A0ABM1YAB5_AEDAL
MDNRVPQPLTTPRNCQSCDRPDAAESEMVQCGVCRRWEHFGCAGVGGEVKQPNVRYVCKQCSAKQGTSGGGALLAPGEEKRKSKGSKASSKAHSKKGKVVPDPPKSVSSSVRAKLLEEELKLVEEEQRLMEMELQEQEEIKKRQLLEEERKLAERRRLAEEESFLRDRKLQEELEMKRKQMQVRKESLEKRQAIIRHAASMSSRSGSIPDSNDKVNKWLSSQKNVGGLQGPPEGDDNDDIQSVDQDPLDAPVNPTSQIPDLSALSISPNSPRFLHAAAPEMRNGSDPATTHNPHTLSQVQIAARQVLGKDLPTFGGNPEDWPIFITNFEQSTATCGYSDAENLVRLQRCLKGNALESVRSRLLLPASVPHVIKTLRILYGRPELLIRSLLNKIQQVPAPRHDRLETLIQFGLSVQNLVDHLKAAEQLNHLSNPALMQELVEKLPGSLRLDWAIYKNKNQLATLETFADFMSGLVMAASEVSFELPTLEVTSRGDKRKSRDIGIVYTHATERNPAASGGPSVGTSAKNSKPCVACGRTGHRVAECHQFKSATVDERWKLVQQEGLCRTCLNSHGKWPCRSWNGCGIQGCRQRHNTLLHTSSPLPENVGMSASHVSSEDCKWPLFRIVPVVLFSDGFSKTIFAFIDEGSSYTLLEESVAKQLGANGQLEPLTLQWTGNVKRKEPTSQRVQLEICGKGSTARHKLIDARTVSQLVLPSQSLKYGDLAKRFPHLRGLPLEDYELVQPKLLIGLDNLRLCVPLKLREGGPRDPIGAKCRLGWSIYGCIPGQPFRTAIVSFHVGAVSDADRELNEQLRDYFTLENVGVSGTSSIPESEEEKRAQKLLTDTTRRVPVGSGYETGLLWRTDNPSFPDSYPMAVRRLEALERKLVSKPELERRVREQIVEYVHKGYAHKASLSELTSVDAERVWYLPLGAVTTPRKPGKVRLIWDAAAKVGNVSFNSKLLKGPDLLTPLPKVLSQFRQFPIAVCGDIMEMFHQIRIRTPDNQSQRFLFRNSPADHPDVYVMDVATFGSTCSPASAQYIKNLNAEEHSGEYPRAAAAVMNKHYVDDYLDSFETVQEAISVVNEVKLVHSKGGFTLRHFSSNEAKVLEGIGASSDCEPKSLDLERGEKSESVLGMQWIPHEDVFVYALGLREDLQYILAENHVPTKREIARVVMSLFDPLGFISFFLVHGKILLQDVWAKGTEWDQQIPDDITGRWQRWSSLFNQLVQIRIPRCYFPAPFPSSLDRLQLHLFVDASESAYASVAYFRLETESGVQVALVGAKTKVAPLKTISIPRLELKAAILGIRLLETIQNQHEFSIHRRYCWTDSGTVLAWIRSKDHRRFHKFVAVRVGEILSSTEQTEWKWVPTKLNVADLATKWGAGPHLAMDSPWFQGPNFLRDTEDSWPKQRQITPTSEELRTVHFNFAHFDPIFDFSRFNSWAKLHRSVAYTLRFPDNVKRKKSGYTLELGVLTSAELQHAEELLWKTAQTEAYPNEVATLMKSHGPPELRHNVVEKSSGIYTKWPYIDERGVLRSRGRIGAAPYTPLEAKYPVILPKQHIITFLIVDWYHRRFRHANRETIVNEIRQRFDIPTLRRLVDQVAKNCAWCRIAKAAPKPPAMAPLPEIRLTAFVQPFASTGLDYFGPVLVKVGRSNVKRWVALFTCLTTRAIHLEVVYSLSTESCIMAVQRFVSRRGLPREFWTDNATCFQGTSNELQRLSETTRKAMVEKFTTPQTVWKFIPPATPHMGGVWERLVRSVKVAIGAIIEGPRRPDEETLETILLEVEAMINSRPLTYVPLESADDEALTPNHFLLGNSSGSKFLPLEAVDCRSTLRSSWKLARYITHEFWNRWLKEYLPVITRRCKWFQDVKDIEVGDLVFVVNGKLKNQWVRGRVTEVYAGRDGRVRQALVQTSTGVIRRAVVNLAVLDVLDKGKPRSDTPRVPDPQLGLRGGVCADNPLRCGNVADCSHTHGSSVTIV